MPLREDLFNPIPGPNPAGVNLRLDAKDLTFEKIKEARREDDNLNQGAWQRERKTADHALVIKLTQETIAKRSKDLELCVWLTEALLKSQGFAGLKEGLAASRELLEKYWETFFPEIEDGDVEFRSGILGAIGTRLELPTRMTPLVRDGENNFGLAHYKESRAVGYEENAKTDLQKKSRDKLLKEGKIAPEAFDKAFRETPKSYYAMNEKELDACLAGIKALEEVAEEKFGSEAPSFGKLRGAVEEVRHTVHALLDKKRETEPDPVEEKVEEPEPVAEAAGEGSEGQPGGPTNGLPAFPTGGPTFQFSMQGAAEPADRQQAINGIVAAAAWMRKKEPSSPAPYLMLRGLRWGELRASAEKSDPTALEAPPTEIRRQIKSLAIQGKWKELIDLAESVMALPCSRAWLDLQRFVVDACIALGTEYHPIAIAIRSELRTLLRDLPQLLQATLMDDTPVANVETQKWIAELLQEPDSAAPKTSSAGEPVEGAAGWQRRFIDTYQLATEALRSGQESRAFQLMQREVERQRSGRGRFQRRVQMVQLCLDAKKDSIAQPILDEIAAAIENHKLEEWEDREMVAAALILVARASKKAQADAKEKQKILDRVCRLDPVQALSL
jgi:type VI secretion system protein ImpA